MAQKIDVFIIDDDETNLQYYQSIINKGDGLRCIGRTTNASTATAIVITTHPDVVLVDYALYPVSGFAIVEQLKQEMPNLPIILLGGRANLSARAEETGATAYLPMPITPRTLLDTIQYAYTQSQSEYLG